MSGRSSRRKGSRGELEVCAILRAAGLDARRTPNSGGLAWRGDVESVPGYVFEVKRAERLDIPGWLRQAYAATRGGEVPVVVFRRDGRQNAPDGAWHAIVPLDVLAAMIAGSRTLNLPQPQPKVEGET